jgi:hypothetical protein
LGSYFNRRTLAAARSFSILVIRFAVPGNANCFACEWGRKRGQESGLKNEPGTNAEPDRECYEPIIGQCGGALKSRPGGLFFFQLSCGKLAAWNAWKGCIPVS